MLQFEYSPDRTIEIMTDTADTKSMTNTQKPTELELTLMQSAMFHYWLYAMSLEWDAKENGDAKTEEIWHSIKEEAHALLTKLQSKKQP